MVNKLGFYLMCLFLVVTIFGLALFYYFKTSLISTDDVSKSFSQYVSSQGLDEYVIAQLVAKEEFIKTGFNRFGEWPIGDTSVEISLVAHYKYYVKHAELKHHIEDGIVFIEVPKLHLSTPVAFDFSTVTEKTITNLFGPDDKEMLNQSKREISVELIRKGQLHTNVEYDKAAKALADNFNSHFKKNGFGNYYKSIVVIFSSEKDQSKRQYNYNDSYCRKAPFLLELDLGKSNILRVE
jgi:hypothetical protein